jgi:feruloyl-CoA synthase
MRTAGAAPRFRAVDLFPEVALQVSARPDGTLLLCSQTPRTPVPATLAAGLVTQAARLGDRTLIAERDATGQWQPVSYAAAWSAATRIAGWLLGRAPGAEPERILIVSGNSTAHALLSLGAAVAGVPICPVSERYARAEGGLGRLAHAVTAVRPTLVFAEQVAPIAEALRAVLPDGVTLMARDAEHWPGAIAWDEVVANEPLADPSAHVAALEPDTVLRFMLTSGSTGLPKVVAQTNRMWCSLFSGANAALSRASGWGVRTLDWMPWSHVAGASVLIGSLLNGGSFYLDAGRPTPDLFGVTLANLADVQPLFFANVPFAFGLLCDALEGDAQLRKRFFEHLQLCLYGGAGLPQPVYDRFQAMAEETIGERVMFTTGYGCTEATAGVMSITWPTTEVGVGLPVPGVQVKLVPLADPPGEPRRYEARFRGECVMPGYLGDPDATARAFDDEGFYRTGDALRFADPSRPEAGLVFAGRLAEEFKLLSGVFVRGGEVRDRILAAAAPVVLDVVLCGEGQGELGVLVWPNPAGVATSIGHGADPDAVLDWLAARLATPAAGSASRIARLALLDKPPDPNVGELSDKGSVNQAIARRHRADDVERLYAGGPGVRILP